MTKKDIKQVSDFVSAPFMETLSSIYFYHLLAHISKPSTSTVVQCLHFNSCWVRPEKDTGFTHSLPCQGGQERPVERQVLPTHPQEEVESPSQQQGGRGLATAA